jgi:hypothetical protein
LFIAEGLLWYILDSEVRELLLVLNRRFPGSRFLSDAPTPLFSLFLGRHPVMGNIGVRFHRNMIGSQRRLNRWSSGISFEGEWRLYDDHPRRWRWLAFSRYVPGIREWGKVVSLRLNGDRMNGRNHASSARPAGTGPGGHAGRPGASE